MNLKAQVTSGLYWGAGGRLAMQISQFGVSVALARLLSPGDYGLMAMVMVFTGFAGMLADAGFNTGLIQRKNMTDAHVYSVFWITLFLGILLMVATFCLAPLLASFFHSPSLKEMFRVISINFVIGAIGNVPSALLQKNMRFRAIAKIDTTALLLSGTVAIAMAWNGAGVWSLVAQPIVATLITAFLRCWACRWFPKCIFCPKALKEIWDFSGHMFGFLFINYWARNADNLIIGKFFGNAALGIYGRAYALMLLPVSQINSVINQIMLPAFSGLQSDKPRIRRIYLRVAGMISLLSSPIMLGLWVVADPFILTVYGSKWVEVVPVLKVLALVGLMQSLVNSCGLLLSSQGRSDLLFFWWTLFYSLVIISFIVGAGLGSIHAVAVSYAIACLIYSYPALRVAGRIVNLSASEILRTVAVPLLAALGMASVVFAIQRFLPTAWPPGLTLAVLVAVGAGAYAVIVISFKLSAWRDFKEIIQQKFENKLTPIVT